MILRVHCVHLLLGVGLVRRTYVYFAIAFICIILWFISWKWKHCPWTNKRTQHQTIYRQVLISGNSSELLDAFRRICRARVRGVPIHWIIMKMSRMKTGRKGFGTLTHANAISTYISFIDQLSLLTRLYVQLQQNTPINETPATGNKYNSELE